MKFSSFCVLVKKEGNQTLPIIFNNLADARDFCHAELMAKTHFIMQIENKVLPNFCPQCGADIKDISRQIHITDY